MHDRLLPWHNTATSRIGGGVKCSTSQNDVAMQTEVFSTCKLHLAFCSIELISFVKYFCGRSFSRLLLPI